jgi:hypothetical protein
VTEESDNFASAVVKFKSALASLRIEAAEKKQPGACDCQHCKNRLYSIETQAIPMIEGQILMMEGMHGDETTKGDA